MKGFTDKQIVDWIEECGRDRKREHKVPDSFGLHCSPWGTLRFGKGGAKTFRAAIKKAMRLIGKTGQRRNAA